MYSEQSNSQEYIYNHYEKNTISCSNYNPKKVKTLTKKLCIWNIYRPQLQNQTGDYKYLGLDQNLLVN